MRNTARGAQVHRTPAAAPGGGRAGRRPAGAGAGEGRAITRVPLREHDRIRVPRARELAGPLYEETLRIVDRA